MNPQILSIIQMDIYLRDERVLKYIADRVNDGKARIRHEEIALKFGCTRQTALAIVHRLEAKMLIGINKAAKRGGYVYSLKEIADADRDRAG